MIYRNNRNKFRRFWRPRRRVWQEMHSMHNLNDFLLGGTLGPVQRHSSAINAWLKEDGLILTAEIPGVDPDNIEVSIVGDNLTLSGSRIRNLEADEEVHYIRRERSTSDFSRSITLPFNVDLDAVEATFNHGVLKLELPRLPEEKPKKIAVKTS